MQSTEASVAPRVAILLSTYNGERFLAEQLASLDAQTYRDWSLYWRDDGSSDATNRVMQDFVASLGTARGIVVPDPTRVGASQSFLRLLRAACADGSHIVAFADQDDVWLPDKLARGVDALAQAPEGVPALYCARQILVDSRLQRIALSATLHRPPGFPAALTQNIATGCTLMLNRAAVELVAASEAPGVTLHDWWCYLLVAAADGQLLFDSTPVVLYRQHQENLVGAPSSLVQRGVAALRRGPQAFMHVFRQNVASLEAQPHLLSATARKQVAAIASAVEGSLAQRLAVLRMRGLTRQTSLETILFRLWFMLH